MNSLRSGTAPVRQIKNLQFCKKTFFAMAAGYVRYESWVCAPWK